MKAIRWFIIVAVLTALIASLLTGCGSGQNQDTGDKVEITFAGWGSTPEETRLLDQVLADFEQSHPNIKVKREVIADQYMDVIKTRLIGGKGPDVFYLDAIEAPGLIETGALEPLNAYVSPDFDVEDFEKPLIHAFQKDEKIYGFPKGYSTLALFYNKKMLKEAGVEVPKTWDELRAASRKLTKGNKVYGFGQNPELARTFFIAQSAGGQVVKQGRANFTAPQVLNALQPYVDQHLIDKTAAQPSDVGASWTGVDVRSRKSGYGAGRELVDSIFEKYIPQY